MDFLKNNGQIISENKNEKIPLSTNEYEEVNNRFGKNRPCSFAKDKKGYYCYTHRCRSQSYESIDKIPMKVFKFISSTG